ncbi:MAG: hypothetical protein N3B01_09020, partial [Verrucomicrobiae bacterium]|nr:hypothetical protein [Verrucomicrobiae bacterium]
TVLRGVAHPLYRKAIERYLAALEALAVGGIGEFRYETRVAQRAHREADALTRQLARYLDQIEQKQVPAGSNRVSKHLKLLGAPLEAGLLRRDPISEYLDRFDRRFPLP